MKIEHVAFQVEDPVAAAKWYAANLGFRIVRSGNDYPWGQFLADSSGTVMVELYKRKEVRVPDYAAMDPLILHLALIVDDVEATRRKLIAAGATAVGEATRTPDGDELAMLRDPWGFPIQLAKRAAPMV